MMRMTRVHVSFTLIVRLVWYEDCVTRCDWWHDVPPGDVCEEGSLSAVSSKMFIVVADGVDV